MRLPRRSALVACLLTSLGACEHATGPQRMMRPNPEAAQMQAGVLSAEGEALWKMKEAYLASAGWQLTPLQRQFLMSPVSPEAAARPATRADLEEVRNWFGPGELEALVGLANRTARLSGMDTVPHCLPLCDPASH
jgi:hypothetical protein